MAIADLTNEPNQVDTGNDSIVIVRNLDAVRGGRTLDVTGFTPEVIQAGHLIIKQTSNGEYKPMPISGSAYASLPAGHTYAGVLINTVLKSKPFAGIMTNGTVNDVAGPYPVTSAMKTAIDATEGLYITFRAD
ncbi:hypothetical protein FVR03_01315 [Pontibacter qinzhouensis]|uniref:Uncharacterized protein n=1 Tax=Pontibacter qinzhouensis TaxID=2603253 RepID=A0A5C8KFP7_9BACT|nr:hypothetical protein [Pontibacter qinzhouensis]TXK52383.1 hypothetical protein FVR03_01315 [Pontibacter qinzhouensis]